MFLHLFFVLNLILLVSPTQQSSIKSEEGELLSLQFIFRHGHRAPITFLPSDPYRNYTWPHGPGRLLEEGKLLMKNLGKVLRKRYRDYLEQLDPTNIRAESSPIRRCITSTECVYNGLFPDSPMIQVHTVPKEEAHKLYFWADCPKVNHIKPLPEYTNFLKKNEQFIKQIHAKLNNTQVSLIAVYDTLYIEMDFFGTSFQTPMWLTEMGREETMRQLKTVFNAEFCINERHPEHVKLISGVFQKEAIENMKSASRDGVRKLFLYGTHDSLIAPLLHSLGLYKEYPNFGSTIIYELRNQTNIPEPTVHLYFVNSTNGHEIYQLKLNESARFKQLCSESFCRLSAFESSLTGFLVDNIKEECQMPTSK